MNIILNIFIYDANLVPEHFCMSEYHVEYIQNNIILNIHTLSQSIFACLNIMLNMILDMMQTLSQSSPFSQTSSSSPVSRSLTSLRTVIIIILTVIIIIIIICVDDVDTAVLHWGPWSLLFWRTFQSSLCW